MQRLLQSHWGSPQENALPACGAFPHSLIAIKKTKNKTKQNAFGGLTEPRLFQKALTEFLQKPSSEVGGTHLENAFIPLKSSKNHTSLQSVFFLLISLQTIMGQW